MDRGSQFLDSVLENVKNMTPEEYELLFEDAQSRIGSVWVATFDTLVSFNSSLKSKIDHNLDFENMMQGQMSYSFKGLTSDKKPMSLIVQAA